MRFQKRVIGILFSIADACIRLLNPRHQTDILHMKRLRKKVNGCDAYGLKRSRINKATQVTCKGCRVTRDIGDCTSTLLKELLYNIRSKYREVIECRSSFIDC